MRRSIRACFCVCALSVAGVLCVAPVIGQTGLDVQLEDDAPIVVFVEDLAKGPVYFETTIMAGMFEDLGGDGFGPLGVVGQISASHPVVVPLPNVTGDQPGAMGGAIDPFVDLQSGIVAPEPALTQPVNWSRPPIEDPSGENPPEAYGLNEFVPPGSFFVEVVEPMAEDVELSIRVTVRPILKWIHLPMEGRWEPISGFQSHSETLRRTIRFAADTCEMALPVTTGEYRCNNSTATTGSIGSDIEHDVWYLFTPSSTRAYSFSTCGSSIETKIALYDTSVCAEVGPATLLAYSDSSIECADNRASLDVDLVAGQPVLLQAGSVPGTDPGEFILEILARPINDRCSNALSAVVGEISYADRATAGSSGDASGCAAMGPDGIERDVWFVFEAPDDGRYVFGLCSDVNGRLALYDTDQCDEADASTMIACGMPPCTAPSMPPRMEASMIAGERLLVQVGAAPGEETESGRLRIQRVPPNDACEDFIDIGMGEFSFDARVATDGPESGIPAGCLGGELGRDIWYRFTATVPNLYNIVVASGAMAVYDAADCTEVSEDTLLTCESSNELLLEAGQAVMIQVNGRGSLWITELGEYELRFAKETITLTSEDFRDGPVVLENIIETGWFNAEGFGPRSYHGSIDASEGVLVPLHGVGSMGGAAAPFVDGPTSGADSTPERLNVVSWFRGGDFYIPGQGPPPPHGVDEFVPVGTFFVEIDDPTSREITIVASSETSNIYSWVCACGGAFAWFVNETGPPQTAEATLTIVVSTCPCDLNGDGELSSDDYFMFLQGFIAGDLDYNGDGVTNSDDFFEFIACWGMPPAQC